MTALEAIDRVNELDKRINALEIAYNDLWEDFDKRSYALSIKDIKVEYELERSNLADKLRAVQL